jgi:hypothetical protein
MLYAKAKIDKFVGASQPFKKIEKVEFFIYCVPLLSHPDVVLMYHFLQRLAIRLKLPCTGNSSVYCCEVLEVRKGLLLLRGNNCSRL